MARCSARSLACSSRPSFAFYGERTGEGAKGGAITVVQRTSSDLRVNPHLHSVSLDGAYVESGTELVWRALGHLQTREVGDVLERTVRRIEKHLRRHKILATEASDDGREALLIESAVWGQTPPAGPQWLRGLAPLAPLALRYDKPLCASLDGFTLHAATRAGALDAEGREALLRYVLRPPLAQERLEQRPDGLVRLALKRAFADGTVAVDMDPLSLLCRLATSVPPPRFHRQVRRRARVGERVAFAHRATQAGDDCSARRARHRVRETEARRDLPPLG